MSAPYFIKVSEAQNIINETVQGFGSQYVDISSALGYTIDEDILADRDFPPFNRVAMDGIAINSKAFQSGQRTFEIQESTMAGQPIVQLRSTQFAIEIMTGCILPVGCDTVIRYEDVIVNNGEVTINLNDINPGQNVHLKGNDRQNGSLLIAKGTMVDPGSIAVLATVGKSTIKVLSKPKIALLSTGDELVDIDQTPEDHQIRKSNSYIIGAILNKYGYDCQSFHLNDDYNLLFKEIEKILTSFDVLVCSGGVSMGKYDFLPKVFEDLGVETRFYKVKERPGKPFWFGTKDNKTIFALPGNPISSTMCTSVYLIPWLQKCMKQQENSLWASLSNKVEFKPDLTYFCEVAISNNKGQIIASAKKSKGSGDLAHLISKHGFIELPQGKNEYQPKEIYKVYLM